MAGYGDWRVPSKIELQSIVDYGEINPSIDGTYFPTPVGIYWSSEAVAGAPTSAWFIDFSGGSAGNNGISSTIGGIRCVR